jgi:hypothetical protein
MDKSADEESTDKSRDNSQVNLLRNPDKSTEKPPLIPESNNR